jgi:predicted Zn finger-like uncharacterized protein
MRLICPNCDAQYEVGDSAIPAGGRDVQCSNCGNTWYQLPDQAVTMSAKPIVPPPIKKPDVEIVEPVEAAPIPKLKSSPPRKPKPPTVTVTEVELPPAAAESAAVADEITSAAVAPTVAPVEAAFDSPPPLQRRKLDDSVASVLREEADREAAARQADAERLSIATTEPARPVADVPEIADVSLPQVVPAAAVDDVAAQISAVIVEDVALAQRATKGRELLPNIEEINSTLRSAADRGSDSIEDGAEEVDDLQQRRRGFRSGFSLMFLIGVLLLLGYISAPRIIQMMPAAEPYVRSYVAQVNSVRFWLDGVMEKASDNLASSEVE